MPTHRRKNDQTLFYDDFKLIIKNTFPIWDLRCILCRQTTFHLEDCPKPLSFFVNPAYVKQHPLKQTKNKIRITLPKTNFSQLETLSLGPKRLLHSKGPKNGICLWLSQDKENGHAQNAPDQKSGTTSDDQLFITRNFVFGPKQIPSL